MAWGMCGLPSDPDEVAVVESFILLAYGMVTATLGRSVWPWTRLRIPPGYHGELPQQYRHDRLDDILGGLGCLSPFLVLSAGAAFFSLRNILLAPTVQDGFGLVFAAAVFVLAVRLLLSLCNRPTLRIVPYFEKVVGCGSEPFRRGKSLARCLRTLDRIAEQAGVEPLSRFGFEDDMRGDIVRWHDPAELQQSLRVLISTLDPSRFLDPLADLYVLLQAVDCARRGGTRMALQLRMSDDEYIPANNRKGTFW